MSKLKKTKQTQNQKKKSNPKKKAIIFKKHRERKQAETVEVHFEFLIITILNANDFIN